MFDIAKFRAVFTQFASDTLYPDALITFWADFAKCELSESCLLFGDCYDNALMLVVAHILTLMTTAAQGNGQTGALTSAAIDKVSVGYTAPPYQSGWQYWLTQTPYGVQLWSLLSVLAAGGFYVNGWPEASAFRRAGGVYT